MPATIETHGDIEIICPVSGLGPNKTASVVFRGVEDATPPFQIRVRSPSGQIILERVLRELPTGAPQSPPPITFTVQAGEYEITVAPLKGYQKGRALLNIR
jgi:hypothetical protein